MSTRSPSHPVQPSQCCPQARKTNSKPKILAKKRKQAAAGLLATSHVLEGMRKGWGQDTILGSVSRERMAVRRKEQFCFPRGSLDLTVVEKQGGRQRWRERCS